MESRTETRRGTIILAALTITAAVVGCGQPGADGDAYIAYSWAVEPITIATNDPAFAGASYIYNGEDGGLFGAGEDGTDLYFELLCLSTGPSVYIWEDLASAALGTDGTELLAVLGTGLSEAPATEAAGAE